MKRIFKFNDGMGAVLCSGCRVILYTGSMFSKQEQQAVRGELDYDLPPKYCKECAKLSVTE